MTGGKRDVEHSARSSRFERDHHVCIPVGCPLHRSWPKLPVRLLAADPLAGLVIVLFLFHEGYEGWTEAVDGGGVNRQAEILDLNLELPAGVPA